MTFNPDELDSLLFDWEEGTLDDGGVQRLRQILLGDETARAYYLQHQAIGAALQLNDAGHSIMGSAEDSVIASPNTPATSSVATTTIHDTRERRYSAKRLLALAATVLVCSLTARLLYLEFTATGAGRSGPMAATQRVPGDEATSQGVALLTRLVDIEWSADQEMLDVGDAVDAGRFAIDSGFAQVEFFCGATVILEGPAELELKSPTLARVVRGRLRAQVPPAARGFSLEVDDMKVVDLGTEFGLSITDAGADVQVFDGEVELHRPERSVRKLTAGNAVSRDAAGQLVDAKVTPESFLDIATLESHARGQQSARYERWNRSSQAMRRDPRLIAYYAFDQSEGWKRRLLSSLTPDNDELDGAIVGAKRVPGRWAKKSGLEFRKPGDRVRVHIPGEFGSLSFACWTRIDSLDRWFNSLFLTDNYNVGEPHWQILDSGQMYFSVRPVEGTQDGPKDFKVLSPPFWNPSLSGKWLHLATTFDVESGVATHYLNGQPIHRESIPLSQLPTSTRIGTASIGNWSIPTRTDAPFAVRNLNGSIDEFAIFSVALGEEEIRAMFENGRP